LFAGKIVAYAGLLEDRELSWLPSYGPEMRGGTASCSVTLADTPIGSPLVTEPDSLIAMNRPSLEKFEATVKPGGRLFYDSSLIDIAPTRTDIATYAVPATGLATEQDLKGLANVIMLGKLWHETRFCAADTLDAALEKAIPPRKAQLLEPNKRALALGKGL
jgi:2-oxoglutarate ferredoxin oxidoreductase subunit gamma